MRSHQLADIASGVEDDFKNALNIMKTDLTTNGWILPLLESNMRNQINISNIKFEQNSTGYGNQMQSTITKLESGTKIVGEVPTLYTVRNSSEWSLWKEVKEYVLKHCLQDMSKKDKNNIVVLHDHYSGFQDIGMDLERWMKDKTVIAYPSRQGKQKDIANLKDLMEKDDRILFTRNYYFDGCEASNIIYLYSGDCGLRNGLLRAVRNVSCIQVGSHAKISGMKEDRSWY